MTRLTSIIIPVYNREHLVLDTLASIKNQNYKTFECIIVDDHSTDGTYEIIQRDIIDDSRFQLYKRPNNLLKGAPNCRNHGLELSQGEFVIFFDSDDLMSEDHILAKVSTIEEERCDMVIAKTNCFDHPESSKTYESTEYPYDFAASDVHLYNFFNAEVVWLTYDTLIKSTFAKQVMFNPTLKRGQEYNYYCKLLTLSPSVALVNKFLTHRRMHSQSIKSSFTKEEMLKDLMPLKVTTLLEIKETGDEKTIKKGLVQILLASLEADYTLPAKQKVEIIQLSGSLFGFRIALLFRTGLIFKKVIGRNHKIRQSLKLQFKKQGFDV